MWGEGQFRVGSSGAGWDVSLGAGVRGGRWGGGGAGERVHFWLGGGNNDMGGSHHAYIFLFSVQ